MGELFLAGVDIHQLREYITLQLRHPDLKAKSKETWHFPEQTHSHDAISDLPDPELKPELARSYPGHTGSPLDGPAKTLKAGVHGAPGGENMLRKPDGSVRYFTVRECARLQTFPDGIRSVQ